jgi:hypothetical protein
MLGSSVATLVEDYPEESFVTDSENCYVTKLVVIFCCSIVIYQTMRKAG